MPAISAATRILLFLYGGGNLAGSALALAGLGLFFAGVIDDWWFLIVTGLYLVGYLVVPANHGLELQAQQEAAQANLAGSVENLLREARNKLPREAIERLQGIAQTVTALAPRLVDGGMAMDAAASLINAVTRDLPQTVRNYARLPAAFAHLHAVENGKTCKQLLLEQLDLLDAQLRKIAENVYKNDAEALVVNGKFLKEKFHSISFIQ